MALSKDGRTLYPFLEGPLVGDDPLVRHVYEFDVKERRYTGRNWIYRMTHPGHVRLRRGRLRPRPADRHRARQRPGPGRGLEEGFVIDVPGNRPNIQKREIVDLLDINDKDGISENPIRPGDFGLGNPFKFPYQTVEAVLPLSGERARVRQRHQFRVDRPEPEPAGLQRLHHRQGARHPGLTRVVPSVSLGASGGLP